jgi:hypothetical protein
MKTLILILSFSIFQTGCFLKRNVDTETGVENPPPSTDVIDLETGKHVYIPPVVFDTVPDAEILCDVREQEVKKGPYDLWAAPVPLRPYDTREFEWSGSESGFEDADMIFVKEAYVTTASGDPVGSFLSSGYANTNGVGPVVWTPEIDQGDYTVYMLLDGWIDIAEHLNNDGTLDLSGEARVRFPFNETYISTQATFDVWYNCEEK